MKKNYSTISFASLLLCMLAVFSLTFASCSDDDENNEAESDFNFFTLDESAWRYYTPTNAWGQVQYDELVEAWTIAQCTPQPVSAIYLGGDCSGVKLVITNMKEEYKAYENQSVIFSGEAVWKYSAQHKITTLKYYICELTLNEIAPFEVPTYTSESINIDVEVQKQTGTLVQKDGKWFVALNDKSVIPTLQDKKDYDEVFISIDKPEGDEYKEGTSVLYSGEIRGGWTFDGRLWTFADGLKAYIFSTGSEYKISL